MLVPLHSALSFESLSCFLCFTFVVLLVFLLFICKKDETCHVFLGYNGHTTVIEASFNMSLV